MEIPDKLAKGDWEGVVDCGCPELGTTLVSSMAPCEGLQWTICFCSREATEANEVPGGTLELHILRIEDGC